jgi:hypothetical protein
VSAQPPKDDLQNIWQNQGEGAATMSLQEFQARLRKLQSKSKHDGAKNIIVGIGIVSIFAFNFFRTEAPLNRFALLLFILGTVIGVIPHILALKAGIGSATSADDVAMSSGIQFYRRLLEPRRTYDKWTAVCLLLIFFGVVLILVPTVSRQIADPNSNTSIRNILPFSVIAVVWCVSFFVFRRRHQRWLQRELELLSALEKENP